MWIYTIFQVPAYHTPECLYLSYTISWVATFLTQLVAFIFVFRNNRRRWDALEMETSEV